MLSKQRGSILAMVFALSSAFLLFAQGNDSTADADGSVPPRGQMGQVVIHTTPEKALVYLGGKKLGSTPIETEFETGRHTLTIMLNGEELVKERVNIWPNKITTIEKTLKMPYGSVTVTTIPANASVSIDGEPVGSTSGGPLTINHVESGTRVFKITSKGKRAKEIRVNVLPEEDVKVDVNLNGK
jgi:hypothetical protein